MHPLTHRMQGWGVVGEGPGEGAATPLHLVQKRKREHLCGGRPRGVSAPHRNPGIIPTLALRFEGTLHLEGPGSGREIPSFPRKAPNLRPTAPADPRGRPPSPPVPPPLGSLSLARSGLDQCSGVLFARPSCPVIAQPGAFGGDERINSGPLNCISPARGPPPAFVPRPARPLCSLSLHALFGKHKTPGPAAGPFQAPQPALENAARLGYLGTPPGARPSGRPAARAPAGRAGGPGAPPPPPRPPGRSWGPRGAGFPTEPPRMPGASQLLPSTGIPFENPGHLGGGAPFVF